MRYTTAFALLSLLVVAACDDERQPSAMPTAPMSVASDAVSAFVVVSNPNPAIGSEVTVWVRALRGSAMGPIGSYTIRLAYDSTRLQFKEAARSAEGMVMANGANRGLVIAAGASAEGFKSDELLASTFVVTSASALSTLELTVTELNSVTFADQKSAVRVERGLYRAATEAGRK